MAKISLAGFKDPVRRPRYIIWTGVAVLMLAAVMIVALGVTSTYWFCAEGCHKVQDDTIIAYDASSHSKVSCMACHMPVSANPVVFILHKAEALGELYLTVTNNYELPLNAKSHVSLTMSSAQCTQCHNLAKRKVTPSKGVLIDHEAHAKVNAACTVCHNRVAHIENFDLTLKDPNTQEPNRKHTDFMTMTACFRCHGLEKDSAAPGSCAACHPKDFELKPDSHREKGFMGEHGDLAAEYRAEVESAAAEAAAEEGSAEETGAPESEASTETSTRFLGKAFASGGGSEEGPVAREDVPEVIAAQRSSGPDERVSIGAQLPRVDSIFYCDTCHVKQTFCNSCHGMDMPHPTAFKEPKSSDDPVAHPALSRAKIAKCVMCHGKPAETKFCDSCHHGSAVNWEFKKDLAWTAKQHPQAVAASGVNSCTSKCHQVKFCVSCHTGSKVVPSSHDQQFWTRPKAPGALTVIGTSPAKPTAGHSTAAQKSQESCGVCHGSGGIKAKFCSNCHKLELPHPAQFKQNHVSSKKNPQLCTSCHRFTETCSNCHHVGASLTRGWIQVHGGSANKNGTAGCVEKCHTKKDCVTCHTARKVIPASHKAGKFVRDFSAKDATHVQLYTKDGSVCTFCHAGEAASLPNANFCNSCHKVKIPHAIDDGNPQKFPHKDAFEKKSVTKVQCANCHQTRFCDSCHHKGSVATKPWLRQHPAVVGKEGAQPCFECHQPTFCANCHVNLAKRGLL